MFIKLTNRKTALRQEGNVYRTANTFQPPSARRASFSLATISIAPLRVQCSW